MIQFENIELLLWIPFILIGLFILIKINFVKNSERKKLRIFVFFTRTIIILLLLLALAAPYTVKEKIEQHESDINILIDTSKSMDVFKDQSQSLINKLNSISDFKVNTVMIGNDYTSPIGNSILNNMMGNDDILLLSDGNSNYGKNLYDVLRFASTINSTINIVNLNIEKNDAAISIEGPKYILSGLENTYYIKVDTVGDVKYSVQIYLDGKKYSEFKNKGDHIEEIKIALKSGYHKLEAKLITNDYNSKNNIYYKSLNVLDKPKVLYVSSGSGTPIKKIFSNIYDLTSQTTIPNNLNPYFGIVLDNLPSGMLEKHTEQFTNYILDGNGMFVIGGDMSYDLGGYDSSQFQTLLPVKVGIGEIENMTDLNVIIIIDISISGGLSAEGGKVIDISKSQAISIFNQLDPQDNVGVIAFNKEAHLISELDKVENSLQVPTKIGKLKDNGGTYIESGLLKAESMLEDATGNKNVIIITDGKTKNPESTLETARKMSGKGINIYTVGIGPGTDEDFLFSLSYNGGGTYFKVGNSKRLSTIFGKERNNVKKEWKLIPVNDRHFITRNILLNSKIFGYNQVVPKNSAQMLISTDSAIPILTTWRFGLGRVASYTTDGGNKWAGNVLKKGNSKLISRATNWVVGDPRRKNSFRMNIEDGKLMENLDFKMYSDSTPVLDGMDLIQIDTNLYSGNVIPTETGFFDIMGEEFAVNYPREYEQLGLNSKLKHIVEMTGGKILDINNPNEIIEKIRKDNNKNIEIRNYYRYYLIPVIIIVYLIEILIRRKVNKNV